MKIKTFVFVLVAAYLCSETNSIFNGIKVEITQIPYIVLLKNSNLFCSGAVISDRHILTAAHCIDEDQTVMIGTDQYDDSSKPNPDIITFDSVKTFVHENYSLPSAVFDIGIIELPNSVNFSKAIRPIKISAKNNIEDDVDDLEIVTAGFGYKNYFSGASPYLQFARMKLISLQECEKFKSEYIEDLNENHICMQAIKGQPCDGDSGAPVISTNTRSVIGVLSYIKDAENGKSINFNDCESLAPTVATRISSYINWISEKTGINFDDA